MNLNKGQPIAAFFVNFRPMKKVLEFLEAYDSILSVSDLSKFYEEDFFFYCIDEYDETYRRNSQDDFSKNGKVFKSYLQLISRNLSSGLFKAIADEAREALNPTHFIEKYRRKCGSYALQFNEKYPEWLFFGEDLKEIQEDLIMAYSTEKANEPESNGIESNPPTLNTKVYPKLQWMGNINVLITLFYDLLHGQDGNENMLKGDKNELKKFLLNNFKDAEGHLLSEATITTLFTPSKGDKRANIGDRIELGTLKFK